MHAGRFVSSSEVVFAYETRARTSDPSTAAVLTWGYGTTRLRLHLTQEPPGKGLDKYENRLVRIT